MTALPTYSTNDVATLPTPALLAIFNKITGKQTKKFASRADAERQTIRAMAAAGRIAGDTAPTADVPPPVAAEEPAAEQPKPTRVRHRPLALADQQPAAAPAPAKGERGALTASVLAAFQGHFATGAESVNLRQLAPKIGITERTLRQAMDALKRKGFTFPSLGQCNFGFVDPRAKAQPKKA